MSEQFKIRWFYIRNKDNHPVGCVASARIPEGTVDIEGTEHEVVAFAVSSLNPKDQWDKKRARQIAVARLIMQLRQPWKRQVVVITPGQIKTAIMERIAHSFDNSYQQSRDAAEYWLSPEAIEARAKKQQQELKDAKK